MPGEDLFDAVNIGPLMEMHNNALESAHSLKAHYSVASSTVLSPGHAWLRPRRRKECIIPHICMRFRRAETPSDGPMPPDSSVALQAS